MEFQKNMCLLNFFCFLAPFSLREQYTLGAGLDSKSNQARSFNLQILIKLKCAHAHCQVKCGVFFLKCP